MMINDRLQHWFRLGYRSAGIGLVMLAVACVRLADARRERPAQRTVRALTREINDGLDRRGIRDAFDRYVAYTADRLDASAGDRTFSDKTGNCRLSWFDWMLRHPVEAIDAAERFTWDCQRDAADGVEGLRRLIGTAADKLDTVRPLPVRPADAGLTPQDVVAYLAGRIVEAGTALRQAYAPLSDDEREDLERHLYSQSTGEVRSGSRFADPVLGRRVCDLIEKIDRAALLRTAAILAELSAPDFLDVLHAFPDNASIPVEGVTGTLADEVRTPAGRILIGGRNDNHYDLEALADVCAVIDLGGNDTYLEGTVGFDRPVLVMIDLGGDDVFTGTRPGIQGAAVLGASLLLSMGGNDRFEANDVAQGAALAGIGMLINAAGDNHYTGRRRVQGQATGGLGMLLDRAGDDRYRAAMLSQGVGGPLGFGALIDLNGADHYYAGGLYPNGYGDSPGFEGWSQGVGVGPRGVANGGIGVMLDGGGDDVYEYDYFSHGGGYWYAAGFVRNFGGNNQRVGATRTMFDGSDRTEPRFVRWGLGYGCHYALGFVFDDEGNDTYVGDAASIGFAWDVAVGVVVDLGGNDVYQAGGVAHAANAGLGVVFDAAGDDRYRARRLGYAFETVEYHPAEQAGGNFAFLIDAGGKDDLGGHADNNRETEQGWAGGFVIRREKP